MSSAAEVRPLHQEKAYDQFDADLWQLGKIGFSHISMQGHDAIRSNAHIHSWNSEFVVLRYYLRGGTTTIFDDQVVKAGARRLMFLDYSKDCFARHHHSEVVAAHIPRTLITYDQAGPNVINAVINQEASSKVLAHAMWTTFNKLSSSGSINPGLLSDDLTNLIRGLLNEKAFDEKARRAVEAARGAAARSYIEQRLGANQLNVGLMCKELGLSRASLYRAFAEYGGVKRYVMQRRLLRAFNLITASEPRRGALARLADTLGFFSPAHFTRAFRDMFGMRPSDVAGLALVDLWTTNERDWRTDYASKANILSAASGHLVFGNQSFLTGLENGHAG